MTQFAANKGYGIGTVAKLTGITTHTLRMWERRYQAVVAKRAANGRRFYTAEDVEKLGLLKMLTQQGTAISQIASLSIAELKQRTETMGELRVGAQSGQIKLAVLGDNLASLLPAGTVIDERIEVLIADSRADRFQADVAHESADVLVVEVATLSAASMAELKALIRLSRASGLVVVFGFGRQIDIDQLTAMGAVPCRFPVTREEVIEAVLAQPRPHAVAVPLPADSEASAVPLSVDLPGRLFSTAQLQALSLQSQALACECPRHLADLVNSLSAFEIYSQQCEQGERRDAAVHAHLHASAARARGLMEEALAYLVRVEQIEI